MGDPAENLKFEFLFWLGEIMLLKVMRFYTKELKAWQSSSRIHFQKEIGVINTIFRNGQTDIP